MPHFFVTQSIKHSTILFQQCDIKPKIAVFLKPDALPQRLRNLSINEQ